MTTAETTLTPAQSPASWRHAPKSLARWAACLIATVAFSQNARSASSPCSQLGVCVGDDTFAYIGHRLKRGHVNSIDENGDASVVIDNDSVSVSAKKLAVSKEGTCMSALTRFCVGAKTVRQLRGQAIAGRIVGYFPATGYLAIIENTKLVSTLSTDPSLTVDQGLTISDLTMRLNVDSSLRLRSLVSMPTLPSLKDLLLTWTPMKRPDRVDSWATCKDHELFDHPIRRDSSDHLLAACQPEVLYSWGPMQKIEDLKTAIGKGPWQEHPFYQGSIYLSETPASSFGYGSNDESGGYAIRIKLKPGTVFQYIGDHDPSCSSRDESEANHTVYVRVFSNDHGSGRISSGADFVLCSSGPVHSWSYGTKEFYDELVKDIVWLANPAHVSHWYSYMRRPGASGAFQPVLWNIGSDGHPFTQRQLQNTLKLQAGLAAHDDGNVYFNPALGASVPREMHFSMKAPLWFGEE